MVELALASGVFVNWQELSSLPFNATFRFSHGSRAHVKVTRLLENFWNPPPPFHTPRHIPGPQPEENPSDLRSTASRESRSPTVPVHGRLETGCELSGLIAAPPTGPTSDTFCSPIYIFSPGLSVRRSNGTTLPDRQCKLLPILIILRSRSPSTPQPYNSAGPSPDPSPVVIHPPALHRAINNSLTLLTNPIASYETRARLDLPYPRCPRVRPCPYHQGDDNSILRRQLP